MDIEKRIKNLEYNQKQGWITKEKLEELKKQILEEKQNEK